MGGREDRIYASGWGVGGVQIGYMRVGGPEGGFSGRGVKSHARAKHSQELALPPPNIKRSHESQKSSGKLAPLKFSPSSPRNFFRSVVFNLFKDQKKKYNRLAIGRHKNVIVCIGHVFCLSLCLIVFFLGGGGV